MISGRAIRVRPALRARANIETFGDIVHVDTLGGERAILVLQTLDRRLTATVVRIPDHSLLTVTFVGASGIFAQGARRARLVQAIIDQLASMSRLSRVTWLTRADLNVLLCRANRVHAARIAGETSYSTLVGVADLLPGAILVRLALDGLAADLIVLGVPEESGFAGANGGVIVRLASSVPPAEEQVARFATLRLANVVLHASLVVRAIVVRRATQLLHADVVVTVLVLGATGVALASRLAEAVDAQLVAYAISRAGAQRGAYPSVASRARGALGVRFAVLDRCAAKIGVTCATRLTRAHRAVVQGRAVRSLAANVGERAGVDAFVIETRVGRTAVAVVIAFQMDALRSWIAGSLAGTSAKWNVVADQAIGVLSANGRHVARIRAPVVDAGGRIGTVEVGEAVPWLLATRLERIPDQSVGTNAGVRAFRVLTNRGRVARVVQTLVDVLADVACQLEARITFAYPSVVGRYAVAVSAIHLIARTCAFVGVLIAILVARAIVVGEALHFEASRRVAYVTWLALARRGVVENGANGVQAAVDQGAGIGAIVLDARLRVGAVSVQRALVGDRATRPHGITGGSLGTHATVRST